MAGEKPLARRVKSLVSMGAIILLQGKEAKSRTEEAQPLEERKQGYSGKERMLWPNMKSQSLPRPKD